MKESNHKKLARRKDRIGARLAPRNWPEQARPMMKGGRLNAEVSDRFRATPVGGVAVIHRMVQGVGLDRAINDGCPLLKRHLPYHESDHVLNLAYNVLAGGTRLEDIDRLREDESLLDLLGAQRIPDPTTAGDFLRRFNVESLKRLMDLINATARDRIWCKLPESSRSRAIIDVDGSLVSTEGEKKRGMDVTYKGIWGYHPLLVSLANTQEPLFIVNRSGNVTSHDGSAEWLDHAVALCRGRFEEVLLRGDTDFALTANFDRWTEADVKFVFGYDANKAVVALASELPDSAWSVLERASCETPKGEPRQRRENTKEGVVIKRGFKNQRLLMEWIAEIPYKPGKCRRPYRLVIVRKDLTVDQGTHVLFRDIRHLFYITNDERMTAEEVVAHANQRCHQENLIEQLKHGIGALRTPVHDLESNWAYMVIASLAWRLKAWFGVLQPNDEDRVSIMRMEFRKFLNLIVRVVCQVVHGGRGVHIRLLMYTSHARLLLLDVARLVRAGP